MRYTLCQRKHRGELNLQPLRYNKEARVGGMGEAAAAAAAAEVEVEEVEGLFTEDGRRRCQMMIRP